MNIRGYLDLKCMHGQLMGSLRFKPDFAYIVCFNSCSFLRFEVGVEWYMRVECLILCRIFRVTSIDLVLKPNRAFYWTC